MVAATKIGEKFPWGGFSERIFDQSGWCVVGYEAYIFGGGHAGTTDSWVVKLDLRTGQWTAMYEPLTEAMMKEADVVAAEIPGETWTDTEGELTAETGNPAGTIYRPKWLDPVTKFWVHPQRKPQPCSRHSYHGWLPSRLTGKFHLMVGNNGTNAPLPVRELAVGGKRAVYDPVANQWTATANNGYKAQNDNWAEDPRTGFFVSLDDWFRVIDPRTDAPVKEIDVKRSDTRAKYWKTPYVSSPFKPDSALNWHPEGEGFVYIRQGFPVRAFYVRVDPVTSIPSITQLTIKTAEGCPMPAEGNFESRKWARNELLKQYQGGFGARFMWSYKVDHVEHSILFDRVPVEGAYNQGTTYCNTVIDGVQYFIGAPTSASRYHTLFSLVWPGSVVEPPDEEPPDEEEPPEEEPPEEEEPTVPEAFAVKLAALKAALLQTIVAIDAFAEPPPPDPDPDPPVDIEAPDTIIVAVRRESDYDTGAVIEFGGTGEPTSFELSLNGAAWAPAVSPVTLSGLAVANQRVEIRAKDAAGNIDPTPAVATWTVKARPVEPPVEPPPIEKPVITGALPVHDGPAGMNRDNFHHYADIPWRQKMGDWVDADGVAYGPKAFAEFAFNASGDLNVAPHTVTQDVTALVADPVNGGMYLTANTTTRIDKRTGPNPPKLTITYKDGTTATLLANATGFLATSTGGSNSDKPYIQVGGGRTGVIQFPDVPNRAQMQSAALTLTGIQYAARVKIFKLWQPKLFDYETTAFPRESGIAKDFPLDQGLTQHPDVVFADDRRPPEQWPDVEKEWRKTLHHHNRPLIRAQNGPFGTWALQGVQPGPEAMAKWGKHNDWDLNKTAREPGLWRNAHRQYITGAGEITARANPYNGIVTTLPRDTTRTDGRYMAKGALSLLEKHLFGRIYMRFSEDFIRCPREGSKIPGFAGYSGWWDQQISSAVGYAQAGDGNGGSRTYGFMRGGVYDGSGVRSFASGWTTRGVIDYMPQDGSPYIGLRALKTYFYNPLQSDHYGDAVRFGTHETGRVCATADRWICMETEVKCNSVRGATAEEQTQRVALFAEKGWGVPVFDANGFDQWGNGTGNRDGILRIWIDDVLVSERLNVIYGHHPDTARIDNAFWENWVHGGTKDPEHDHHFQVGAVVVARKRIGRMVNASGQPYKWTP